MPIFRRKRIRKAAFELTIADLEVHPVWEACLDEEGRPGQDESTMRPLSPKGALSFPDFYGWVATDFLSADSSRTWLGVVQPCEDPRDLWSCSFEIFLPRTIGQVVSDPLLNRWNGIVTADRARIGLTLANPESLPDEEAKALIAIAYRAMGIAQSGPFPLAATPRVPIAGWPKTLMIPGFLRPPRTGSGYLT